MATEGGRSCWHSRVGLFLVLSLLFVTACVVRKAPTIRPEVGRHSEKGIASWYGKKFHGRRTANGERFDMYALTAAHRSLPFGTKVRVTNLENGRSVMVRVNDRGPFIRGRVIDLSYAAAKDLRMVRQGVVKVEITLVRLKVPEDHRRWN